MEASAISGEQGYVSVTWKWAGDLHEDRSQSWDVGQESKDCLTLLHAGPGQGVLTNKAIPGFPVIILYHETQYSKFRHMDPETECLPPVGINT